MLATLIDGRHRSRIWLGAATLFLSAMGEAPAARPPAAEPVFLVIYRAGPEWPPGKTLAELPLREHGRYMLSLHQRGVLRMAGGFADDSGGAAVLQVPDMTAAKAIADDPKLQAALARRGADLGFTAQIYPPGYLPSAALGNELKHLLKVSERPSTAPGPILPNGIGAPQSVISLKPGGNPDRPDPAKSPSSKFSPVTKSKL